MSSSLHFADDFLRTEMEDQELMDSIQKSMHISPSDRQGDMDIGMEGLQVLTRVIDKMLAKVRVDVIDTTVRILHKSAAPPSSHHDEYYLDLQVARISYFDETPEFNKPSQQQQPSSLDESSIHVNNNNNNTIKIITLSSPSIWIRSKNNPSLYSMPTSSETRLDEDDGNSDLEQTEFYEANEGLYGGSNSIHSSFMSGSTTPRAYGAFSTSSNHNKPYEALLFTMFDKENWIRVQMRPSYPMNPTRLSDHTSAIKQIDILCSHIRTMITPKQAAFLADLIKYTTDAMTDSSSSPCSSSSSSTTPDMTTSSSIPRNDSILSQSSSPDLGFDRIRSPSNRPDRLVIPNFNNTTPSSSSSTPSVPDIKIKFQINDMEFYFLVQDGPELPPPSMWQNHECNGCKEIGHIRWSIRELVARYQQFPDNSQKDESTSSAAASSLLSTFDVKVKRMSIDEWIRRPSFELSSKRAEKAWQIPYERYLPILEFDDSIMHDYRHDTQFPSIVQSHSTHRIRTTRSHRDKTHEVIRIRVEKKHAHQSRRFVNGMTSIKIYP